MSEQAVQQRAALPEQGMEYRVGPGHPPKEYQWKKGQSGNPQGRRLSAAINKRLEEAGRPEKLVDSILAKIENEGDVAAFKEIITRHEGNVPTKSEVYTENYYLIEEVGIDSVGDESP